jgi:hypothetical protein
LHRRAHTACQELNVRPERLQDLRMPRGSRLVLATAAVALLAAVPAAAQMPYPPPYPYYGAGYARYESDLRVIVKPSNASVFVDGYFAGEVDDFDGVFQRLHLEPGTHEIVVYLAGHRSIRERLYFSPNSTRKVSGTLDPVGPGEADEGPPVPLNPPQPPAAPGRVPPGSALPRRGPSPPPEHDPGPGAGTPSTSSRVGTLSISVQPGVAEVIIDGERWSTGDADERLLIQLSEGRHVIEVRKNGYRAFSTEVQMRGGETEPLDVSLTPDR